MLLPPTHPKNPPQYTIGIKILKKKSHAHVCVCVLCMWFKKFLTVQNMLVGFLLQSFLLPVSSKCTMVRCFLGLLFQEKKMSKLVCVYRRGALLVSFQYFKNNYQQNHTPFSLPCFFFCLIFLEIVS